MLYCFDGVVIAAFLQPFWDLLCPLNLDTRTWICQLNFAQRPIFSGLRFFNEPEISDSGCPAESPSRRTCSQDFYVLKNPSTSAGFEPANLGSRGEHTSMLPQTLLLSCTLFTLDTSYCVCVMNTIWSLGSSFSSQCRHLWLKSSGSCILFLCTSFTSFVHLQFHHGEGNFLLEYVQSNWVFNAGYCLEASSSLL
jgi:hypothetical protein